MSSPPATGTTPAKPEAASENNFEIELTKYKVRFTRLFIHTSTFHPSRYRFSSPTPQKAADIVHEAMKKLVELSVDGAKVLDLCIEGDKLIEQGTGAVYNNHKGGKAGKIPKGSSYLFFSKSRFRASPFKFGANSRVCFMLRRYVYRATDPMASF
jgi:hypothetical protein